MNEKAALRLLNCMTVPYEGEFHEFYYLHHQHISDGYNRD